MLPLVINPTSIYYAQVDTVPALRLQVDRNVFPDVLGSTTLLLARLWEARVERIWPYLFQNTTANFFVLPLVSTEHTVLPEAQVRA